MYFIHKYSGWLVFLIGLVICTSFIGLYPIYILDEARNSEAAREMLISGDFIVPYFNGELRTDKPPLHYYFMALGYQLFGINAFGARFFSGVFGALTLLITFRSVRNNIGSKEAYITTLILLSSLLFIFEFHLAVPDPYLIFFISASLFSFYEFYTSGKRIWLFWAYAGIGLGMLTKGPIALVLPGLSLTVFLLIKKEFHLKRIFAFKPILGVFFSLVIALPWYYLVHEATTGEWTKGFFLDHNVNRFNSGKEGHGGIFLLTPIFVFLGLLPFSTTILQGFKNGWAGRKHNDLILFALIISTVTVVFFSIASTKLPNYPMPCYPFVAILLGSYLSRVYCEKSKKRGLTVSLWVLLAITLLLPIGGYIALSLENQFKDLKWVALWLTVLPVSAIMGLYFYRNEQCKRSFLSISTGWMVTGLLFFGIIWPALNTKNPVEVASKVIAAEDDIIVYQRFDSAFPINFNRTFPVVESIAELKEYLEEHPNAYILTNTRDKESLKTLEQFELLVVQKALFENHTTRVYKK